MGIAAPVLIERSLLLESNDPDNRRVEHVVAFQRKGRRIVLVAHRPRSWRPTRRNVDLDLALQQRLHQLFTRAGAELDGVLYFDTGLFTSRHRQKNDFERAARRYGRNVSEMTLIGTDQALLEAASRSGLQLQVVGHADVGDAPRHDDLETALASIS